MRLLIATDAFPPRCGGSGWSTYYLARALQARGHQVEIVQPRQGAAGVRERVYKGLTVTEFGFAAWNVPGWRAWQRAHALEGPFTSFLVERAREADLIHAQHLQTIPPAVAAGRAAHVPVVSTVRDYWPVCLYGTLWREGAICPICRGPERVRCLRQKYGPAATLAYPFLPLVDRELARRQRALAESATVVAVSHYVANTMTGIVPDERMAVVPNLVAVDELERLAASAPAPGVPYLLFIGKLSSTKGADVLPQILEHAGVDLKLLVVGDGELTAALARVPNVELCGWLDNEQALQLLAHARAFLAPSRWAEPLARVLLEAQALGVPTVALDTGGTRDIIEHEVNGLLASTPAEFAAQVARLVQDDELYTRLSQAARQVARSRFDEPIVAQQMERVYHQVLERLD